MTIKLLDHEIKVKLEDPGNWDRNNMGHSDIGAGTITIDNTMPTDTIQSTLIHELIHIIAGLNSISLTEQSVDGLAIGIYSFIKNNPDWMEHIK